MRSYPKDPLLNPALSAENLGIISHPENRVPDNLLIILLIQKSPKIKAGCRKIGHSLLSGFDVSVQVPLEKLHAGRTKIRLLRIGIFNPGGRIHDATPIPAMRQTQAVAQFMQCRLFHTRQKERWVRRLVIKLGTKPMG